MSKLVSHIGAVVLCGFLGACLEDLVDSADDTEYVKTWEQQAEYAFVGDSALHLTEVQSREPGEDWSVDGEGELTLPIRNVTGTSFEVRPDEEEPGVFIEFVLVESEGDTAAGLIAPGTYLYTDVGEGEMLEVHFSANGVFLAMEYELKEEEEEFPSAVDSAGNPVE